MGLPARLVQSCLDRSIPFLLTLHDYWWICANAQLLTNYGRKLCAGPVGYLNCARCVLARARLSGLWLAIPPIAALLAWRSRLLRKALAHAAQLIAPSGFVASWYGAHGVPDRKIVLLPHGLERPTDLDRARGRTASIKLAYVGGLAWQKGVHILVEALRGLEDRAELLVAGDETLDPDYVAGLRSEASANVRFLGSLSREKVWRLLSQVDAVAVPSLWNETFSLLLHEAHASGLPVLASRLGALTEAVDHERNGLLLTPGQVGEWRSAIQRLVDEPGLLATLRAGVTDPMTLDEHVDRIEAIYSLCLSQLSA
jgi:glycosyltransferase involved in cell wall biosynthesis